MERNVVLDIAPVHFEEGKLTLLDQTKLPGAEEYIEIKTKSHRKEVQWESLPWLFLSA